MAKPERVREAADALRAKGERASYRNVNAWLIERGGPGCSNSDLRDTLRKWVRDEKYDAKLETGGLPRDVSAALKKAGAKIWAVAEREFSGKLDRERARLRGAAAQEHAFLDEALATLDAREAEIERLKSEVAFLANRLDETEERLRKVRADEYWDRVVREIHALLPEREPMHVRDIAEMVGPDLVEEAKGHREEWSVATIRKKLETRVFHGRLFEKAGPGLFRRRAAHDVRRRLA